MKIVLRQFNQPIILHFNLSAGRSKPLSIDPECREGWFRHLTLTKLHGIALTLLFFILPADILGQQINSPNLIDSTKNQRDSSTLRPWEIVYGDSLKVDTPPHEPPLNVLDSAAVYFMNDRLDLSRQIIGGYGHDAGDFLRFTPSNFCIDYQPLPMRKIVSPFGLPGDRLNVIMNNRGLHPIEHLAKPDNHIEFGEIPTAAVQGVFNIEGPLGLVFGGDNATSSLILLPTQPDSFRAVSGLVVDKGDFGYANTKAVFTERKKSGRFIQAATEYRRTDGISFSYPDSSYHYWVDIAYPLREKLNLKLNGRIFRRRGEFPVRFDKTFSRNRRDRDLSAALEYLYTPGQKSSLEFRHQHSESEFSRFGKTYKRDLDILDNSLHLSHEALMGNFKTRAELILTEEEFSNYSLHRKRHRVNLKTAVIHGNSSSAIIGYLGMEKVGGYDPAPSGTLAFIKSGKVACLSASLGYSTKFPRQYELDLPPVTAAIIDGTINDYYESGNGRLKPERQVVGNLLFAFGENDNDLEISLTGGKIFDGIDWNQSIIDSLGLTLTAFRAENRDIEFANSSIIKKIALGEGLFWTGGGSYRYLSIDGNDNPPYSPDYQAFSSLELHYYLRLLDLHLYGYLETSYVGPYKSYPAYGDTAAELGADFVTNLKLSFRIKSFRFYYYWQNLFIADYEPRHTYGIRDLLIYYGFTWEFLD